MIKKLIFKSDRVLHSGVTVVDSLYVRHIPCGGLHSSREDVLSSRTASRRSFSEDIALVELCLDRYIDRY